MRLENVKWIDAETAARDLLCPNVPPTVGVRRHTKQRDVLLWSRHMTNPRYYPADEYAETQVLDEQTQEVPADEGTQELRAMSVQELERVLKSEKPAK